MSLLSNVISNLFGGVSQQSPELRLPSQATRQDNAMSSPVDGLKKRPGTQHIAQLSASPVKPLVHFINRDSTEQYAVTIDNGTIKAVDVKTGESIPVSTPNGTDYLKCTDPSKDLRLVSVADYTFVVNTQRSVQMTSELADQDAHLRGTITFAKPVARTPAVDGTSGTGGGTGTGGNGYWGSFTGPDYPDYTKEWPTDSNDSTFDDLYGDDSGSGSGGGTVTPPPEVVPVKQNPDGTYPPSSDPDNTSYESTNQQSPLPGPVGDGDLMATLAAQGFTNSSYLVVYEQPVSCMPLNSGDFSSYFAATSYAFEMQTVAAAALVALQGDGYSVDSTFMRVMDNIYVSFPKLVVDNDSRDLADLEYEASRTNSAVWYTRNTVYVPLKVLGVLAFDATLVFKVTKDGVTSLKRLPMRLSFPGCSMGEVSPTDNKALNMFCANPNYYYNGGNFLYNKQTHMFDIPFNGFANELHRYVEDAYTGQVGKPPFSYLSVDRGGAVPYDYDFSVGEYKYYSGHTLKFVPPMGYRIMPMASVTQSSIGPAAKVFRSYNGRTLIEVPLTSLPA